MYQDHLKVAGSSPASGSIPESVLVRTVLYNYIFLLVEVDIEMLVVVVYHARSGDRG